jgi:hypothetical protein
MTNEVAVVGEREKEGMDALTKVQSWIVKTPGDFLALDSFLVGLNALKNKILADFKDSKDKAFAAHRAICTQEKGHLDKVQQAYTEGKAKLVAWKDEEDRKTAAAQAVIDAAAEVERKRTEALAKIAEKKGNDAESEALRAATPVLAPRLSADIPKASTAFQTRWSADVTDPLFVLKAVQSALVLLSKAKTPAGIKAHADLVQAEKDLAYMGYVQTSISKLAVAGSPYINGVLRLGGVSFSSRKV